MARPNHREELTKRVQEYLAEAEQQAPAETPLDIKHVAAVLDISRMTLFTYELDKVIAAAA